MYFFSKYFVFMFLFVYVEFAESLEDANSTTPTRVTFLKTPSAGFPLLGLHCAYGRYKTHRGVRYNPHTKDCDALNETWFKDKIVESGFDYFQLDRVEPIFQPTEKIQLAMPNLVLDGLAVVVIYETYSLDGTQYGFSLNFGTNGYERGVFNEHIVFHTAATYHHPDAIRFNYHMADTWSDQDEKTHFQHEENTEYEMKFVLGTSSVRIYIDGVRYHTYHKQFDLSNFQLVDLQGITSFKFRRAYFSYPLPP